MIRMNNVMEDGGWRMEDGRGRRAEDRGQVSEVRVLTWLIGVDFKYFFATDSHRRFMY